jgi:hypothetical protein
VGRGIKRSSDLPLGIRARPDNNAARFALRPFSDGHSGWIAHWLHGFGLALSTPKLRKA